MSATQVHHRKMTKDQMIVNIVGYILIGIFALVCVIPFYLIIVASFTDESELIRNGYPIIPTVFSVQSYLLCLKNPVSIAKAYGTTIGVTAVGTAFAVFIATMTGYVLSRKDFPWRNKFSFFFFFLSALKVNYKVNISAGIVMVIVYSLMTGLGASVVRATFMLVFVLIGKLIDRDAHSISLLAFVAFLMLLYNPMYINDVGFQLSFIVTFGLLIMTPFLMRGKNKFVNWVIGTVSIPIIAQLWVMPIQIFYFNNISLYSVFANIMSVPILSVISFGGFVSSLIATITPSFVCRCFDFVLNPMLTLLVNISDFWGKLPNAAIQTTHPSVFQIILYYAVLLLITALMDKNIRENYLKPIKLALPVLIVVLCLSQISFPNHNLEITAFDVGNADAFLIKTPDNKYLMIDTAKSGYNGGKSQAKMLILKYLMDRGINNIDTIIVTHFDNDHCGGAVDLMEGVNVKNLYVPTAQMPKAANYHPESKIFVHTLYIFFFDSFFYIQYFYFDVLTSELDFNSISRLYLYRCLGRLIVDKNSSCITCFVCHCTAFDQT